MICTNCRRILKASDEICEHCGNRITDMKKFDMPTFETNNETTLKWILNGIKNSFKVAPKKIAVLAVVAGIIFGVNIIFWWWLEPFFMGPPFNKIVNFIIFMTATYNNVIPKTIYWVLILIFYRRLVIQTISKGVPKTFRHMKQLYPMLKEGLKKYKEKGYAMMVFGFGIGLIIANNFSSYSRFPDARNKMDKYFVVLVICFAIIYSLNKYMHTGFFKFVKLFVKDITSIFNNTVHLSDHYLNLLFVGFVAGALFDAIIIIMNLKYGGYILGVLLIVVAIVLSFFEKTERSPAK